MSRPDDPSTQKVTESLSPPPQAAVDLESEAVGGGTVSNIAPLSPPSAAEDQESGAVGGGAMSNIVPPLPPPPPPPPPAAVDLESGAVGGGAVSNIVRRWERDDLLKKCTLASRALGFVFSFLAYIIMASTKHGDWREFDKYEEYRYAVEISIVSACYAGLQSLRQIHELSTSTVMLSRQKQAMIDFCGDQILAYMLLAAGSSAVPLTKRMRAGAVASACAVSMEFFAFFVLAFSSLISGYKLSNSKQSYI